jgi:hypothetical protein
MQLPVLSSVDPSIGPTDELFFEHEFALEFRAASDGLQSRFIRFRIINTRDEVSKDLMSVRFEICDDADLYFCLTSTVTNDDFEKLKATTGFLIPFSEFPAELKSLLVHGSQIRTDITVCYWEDGDRGVLEFNQLFELRAIEIFKLHFTAIDPQELTGHVQYRYDKLSFDLAQKRAILHETTRLIHARIPVIFRKVESRASSPR